MTECDRTDKTDRTCERPARKTKCTVHAHCTWYGTVAEWRLGMSRTWLFRCDGGASRHWWIIGHDFESVRWMASTRPETNLARPGVVG